MTNNIYVTVVTGDQRPELTANGQTLLAALRDRGFEAAPTVLSDPVVEWAHVDVALLRSCWEYHETVGAVREWIDGIDRKRRLVDFDGAPWR